MEIARMNGSISATAIIEGKMSAVGIISGEQSWLYIPAEVDKAVVDISKVGR